MTRLTNSLARSSRRGNSEHSALGYLADIEVAVNIQSSNGAVLKDIVGCDSELCVFVAMVGSFAIKIGQNIIILLGGYR